MSRLRIRLFAVTLLLAGMAGFGVAQSAVLFEDDFEAYASGSNLNGQGGWVGTGVNLVNTATHLSGTSLLGPPNSGIRQLNLFGHSVGGALAAGGIYTLSFDVYAQTTSPLTHSSGLGVGNAAASGAGSFTGSAMWVPVEYAYNGFGWRFDARQLTGGANDYQTIAGGYNALRSLDLVVDAVAMEIYGRFDFGAGLTETTHYAINLSQLAGIDAVAGYADYRGQNGGATTPWGHSFSNAEYDNIVFSSNAVSGAVPVLPVWGLLLIGFLSPALRRR